MEKKPKEIILKKYNRYNDLGHMLISFVSKGINWKKKNIRALIMEDGLVKEQICPFPWVVINRCYSNRRKTI